MNILIVGNADSIYIKSVIEKTMIDYDDKVSVLSPKNSLYADFYSANQIKVYKEKLIKGIFGILISGILNFRVLSSGYDIVCFHYIAPRSLIMIPIVRLWSKKIIASYWGSDLFRAKQLKLVSRVALNMVDEITLISKEMKKTFHRIYGRKYDKKISIVDFGSENIEHILNNDETQETIRMKYNIGLEKVVLSIGYNSNPEQQHIKVLEKVNQLPRQLRDRLHIILRITYGSGSDQYISSLKKLVIHSGCSYSFFESYLSSKCIAEITEMTDVFIHAQTTDAQSATMCEHLLANCVVFNPQWIRYQELENRVFYITYTDFDDMLKKLSRNIEKKEKSQYYSRLRSNREIIYQMCSWETHIPQWRKVYHIGQ